MIRVRLDVDERGLITGCQMKGHSGYAEAGHDIVCAAVSVLGAACVNSLESVCGIQPILEGNQDGLLSFRLPENLNERQLHDAQVLMGALRQGLSDVSDAYPRHVQLAIQERRD